MMPPHAFIAVFRQSVFISAVAVASIAFDSAWAQSVPPTKVVITFPAGSGGDLLTRTMAEHIARTHGLNFTFENADQFVGTEGRVTGGA